MHPNFITLHATSIHSISHRTFLAKRCYLKHYWPSQSTSHHTFKTNRRLQDIAVAVSFKCVLPKQFKTMQMYPLLGGVFFFPALVKNGFILQSYLSSPRFSIIQGTNTPGPVSQYMHFGTLVPGCKRQSGQIHSESNCVFNLSYVL